ncbi:SDR family NAD(P)-dependent oxidoreductase [Burkholderia multivorans]|nr:SDR family NAD(P)-dependent oxidoreductase [Burkholderia multivorans]
MQSRHRGCGRTSGQVDTLVNAAAMTDRGTILDTTPERFDRIFATNVRAPFFLMQETIRLMRETGTQGAIVNICSTSSKAGRPFIAASLLLLSAGNRNWQRRNGA